MDFETDVGKFEKLHAVCPDCGSIEFEETTGGLLELNRVTCGCGWKGRSDELVEAKELRLVFHEGKLIKFSDIKEGMEIKIREPDGIETVVERVLALSDAYLNDGVWTFKCSEDTILSYIKETMEWLVPEVEKVEVTETIHVETFIADESLREKVYAAEVEILKRIKNLNISFHVTQSDEE